MNSLSELLSRYSDLRKEIKTLFSAPNVRDLIAADFTENLSRLEKVVGLQISHLKYMVYPIVYFEMADGNIWDECDIKEMFFDNKYKPILNCIYSFPRELLDRVFGTDVQIYFKNGQFKVESYD